MALTCESKLTTVGSHIARLHLSAGSVRGAAGHTEPGTGRGRVAGPQAALGPLPCRGPRPAQAVLRWRGAAFLWGPRRGAAGRGCGTEGRSWGAGSLCAPPFPSPLFPPAVLRLLSPGGWTLDTPLPPTPSEGAALGARPWRPQPKQCTSRGAASQRCVRAEPRRDRDVYRWLRVAAEASVRCRKKRWRRSWRIAGTTGKAICK